MNLLRTIIFLILIINKINNWKKTWSCQEINQSQRVQGNIYTEIVIKKRNANNFINKHTKKFHLLLLLLGGDIKTNPGPGHTCLKCKKEIMTIFEGIKCQTCEYWCHRKCEDLLTGLQNLQTNEGRQYVWICPNPLCKPNLILSSSPQIQNHTDPNFAENKYNILGLITSKENKLNKNNKEKQTKKVKTKEPVHRKTTRKNNLWSELPRISSKAYIGRDICRSCNQDIQRSQNAILCDSCQTLIHRKCSDMSIKNIRNIKRNAIKTIGNLNGIAANVEIQRMPISKGLIIHFVKEINFQKHGIK